MPKCKTPAEIIREANELAHQFYRSHGYQVPEGYRFDRARHLQERGMWNLVVIAYEHLRATDLGEVLAEAEADEEDGADAQR